MGGRKRKLRDGKRALKQGVMCFTCYSRRAVPLESLANKNGRQHAIEEEDYLQMTGREVKAKPVSSSTCSLSS